MRHRPELDGLRGVAVALVLLAHFTRVLPDGGEVAVGLFFGLSGYLITRLLLDEHSRGRVDLLAFYARRFGRLAPGLFAMLAVCGTLLHARGLPVARPLAFALTYTTNYATANSWLSFSPFGHCWSLAIEEHFYLLWAPVLVWQARRGGARAVLQAALVGATVSVMWRLVLTAAGNPGFGMRDTFARGDALLIGCAAAAALRCGWRPPRVTLPLSVVTVAALVVFWPTDRRLMLVAVGLLAWASAGIVVGLEGSPLVRVLSTRPMVQLGVVSYSLYLWHYPLLTTFDGLLPRPVILVMSVGAAVLSYRYVEKPIRSAVRARVARRSVRAVPAYATS